MDTLHIKVGQGIHEELKRLGKTRGMSVSELIRQALIVCYQLDLIGLSDRQKQSLEAYKGGFISLGKLSELMGRSPVEMRQWLTEHHIAQNNTFSEEDTINAR
jgi:hypothetical protein